MDPQHSSLMMLYVKHIPDINNINTNKRAELFHYYRWNVFVNKKNFTLIGPTSQIKGQNHENVIITVSFWISLPIKARTQGSLID